MKRLALLLVAALLAGCGVGGPDELPEAVDTRPVLCRPPDRCDIPPLPPFRDPPRS